MGSKFRFGKKIASLFPKAKSIVEPFVGGGGLTRVLPSAGFQKIICGDINRYLIAYYKAVQQGWVPEIHYSEEFYNEVKEHYRAGSCKYPDHLIGYLGFTHSFMGRFWGSFTNSKRKQDYSKCAHSTYLKDKKWIQLADFYHCEYHEAPTPPDAVIYCDPPYKGTAGYATDLFDHEQFWQWVRQKIKTNAVFISEQQAPDDFAQIWADTRLTRGYNFHDRQIEKVFVHQSQYNFLKPDLLFSPHEYYHHPTP